MRRLLSLLLLSPFFCFSGFAQQVIPINFTSGPLTLNGTLTLPAGSGPFPLVVICHGSGPTDRNGTFTVSGGNANCIYPNSIGDTFRPYLDIAEALQDTGIATFRYDKRTFTHASNLDPETIEISDFKDDLVEAIQHLSSRTDIESNSIYLAGHSQGAAIIPEAAKQVQVAGLISLAGASTRIDTLIGRQTFEILKDCQQDSVLGANQQAQILAAMDAVFQGSFPNNQALMGAYPLFWKSWMDYSTAVVNAYHQAQVKLLFLQGTDDFNVPLSELDDFSNAGYTNAQFKTFNGLNHFFNDGTDPHVHHDVNQAIIEFILGVPNSTQPQPLTNSSFHIIDTGGFIRIANEKRIPAIVELYDLNGRLILERTLQGFGSLEVGTINHGFYLISVRSKEEHLKKLRYF